MNTVTLPVPALELSHLRKAYGGLVVTDDVSLSISPGARHALIGPNGAGKTTLVGLVSGAIKSDGGRIRLLGSDIGGLAPEQRVKAGLVRTFQVSSLFPGLTVIENVYLAVSERRNRTANFWGLARQQSEIVDRAATILRSLNLLGDAARTVDSLSYGRQRLVEIAIALALEPKVLLLDEPAAGIPSGETKLLLDALALLPSEIAIVMIEHDMKIVREFATAVTVLVFGRVIVTGDPHEVMNSDEVKMVYLGKAGHERFAGAKVSA